MSVRELRLALRKKDEDHAKAIEKLKTADAGKQRLLESKNLQIDDLQQKLIERESAVPSWPAVVNGINLDVTVAAGETLQGFDRLTRQLERILTVELPGEPADHDAALRMMAVHLYDLADQVMQAAQGFADACEANLSGYKTLG
ncbi:hypothetical protein [Methylococcus mesophilus]|uniref:hypothetical protein n=1 Tax=Methylococcus mesophilus TaxID=2993564 RepID=UPI00224AB368|nr:hypothetical protein [Methylococcus mesophilus]UZR27458.1 hypothetical protein OOT43_12010 [Methylococcus mesophilus]